jgi:hypothetical protein
VLKNIAVIANGCSSIYAARLSEQVKLSPLVLIETKMTLREKDALSAYLILHPILRVLKTILLVIK